MTTKTTTDSDSGLFNENLARPVYRLLQIQIAAFFGGPLAATYMMAENFKTFDQPELVKKTWLIGIGTTILYFGVAFNLAENWSFLGYALTAGLIYSTTALVKKWQSAMLDEHFAQGGRTRSGWNCLAVILVSILFVVMAVIPYYIYAVFAGTPEQRLKHL